MSKIPEKLIHEIHDIFERYESEASYGGLYERPYEYSKLMWKEIIARIGKAYADGELELPNQGSIWTPADNWGLRAWARWCLEELGARTFIALCKEEKK